MIYNCQYTCMISPDCISVHVFTLCCCAGTLCVLNGAKGTSMQPLIRQQKETLLFWVAAVMYTCIPSFYNMISNVAESQNKDLKRMLEKYVLDACDWTKHIASTTTLANHAQGGVAEESCPSFLRKHCVAASWAKGDWLEHRTLDSYMFLKKFIHGHVLPSWEYVVNADRLTRINHYFSAPNNTLACWSRVNFMHCVDKELIIILCIYVHEYETLHFQ